jgi:hypothetical protein
MADPVHLQLDDLLFPTLEIRTNNTHDPRGNMSGTLLKYGKHIQKAEGQPGKFAMVVSVASDNENSVNPPYQFLVEAYAIVSVNDATMSEDAASTFVQTNALPLIMGAIRERLTQMTARAPWGRFLINAVPLSESSQIVSI